MKSSSPLKLSMETVPSLVNSYTSEERGNLLCSMLGNTFTKLDETWSVCITAACMRLAEKHLL